ncbi:MAG TPA: hypothetical protein PKC21_00070 [Oligoflexia bacterium]|nr:hypothetical protein [Oligoflexia bacterium]HMR23721.1 hypothetical protein [Oligoflexia bacterium]
MILKVCLRRIFLTSLFLFFASVYAQKDIRVVAFDDLAIEKYGPVKVLLYLANTIHQVKSGDIIFDVSLWEPINFENYLEDPSKRQTVLDYQNVQRVFFENIEIFCKQALMGEKFFITAPGNILFYEQAYSLYLKSLKNLGLKEELPDCIEFTYAKGYEKIMNIDGYLSNHTTIVKLENTDLQHMAFAVNRLVWREQGSNSIKNGVERELLLEYDLINQEEYYDENYFPQHKAIALSEITEANLINADVTIFASHSPNRDSFMGKVEGKIYKSQWCPGYLLIILGIQLAAQI